MKARITIRISQLLIYISFFCLVAQLYKEDGFSFALCGVCSLILFICVAFAAIANEIIEEFE